jgi:hypothetical protein
LRSLLLKATHAPAQWGMVFSERPARISHCWNGTAFAVELDACLRRKKSWIKTIKQKGVTTVKMPSSWGMTLLAVFLVLTGAVMVFNLSFSNEKVIEGILAIAAGILIFIGR